MAEKGFDCVRMMRDIRDKLHERYKDPGRQEADLKRIREKYGLPTP